MDYILGNRYALILNFLIFIIVPWLYMRMSLFYMWEDRKDRERMRVLCRVKCKQLLNMKFLVFYDFC